jgi:hypothetical protein
VGERVTLTYSRVDADRSLREPRLSEPSATRLASSSSS